MVAEISKTLVQKTCDANVEQIKIATTPKKPNRYPMIFVGGLGVSTTSEELMKAFETEGFSITIYPKIRTGRSFSYCPTVALATVAQVDEILSIGELWVKDRFAEIREYKTRSKDKIVNDPRGKKTGKKKRGRNPRKNSRHRESTLQHRTHSQDYEVPRNYHQQPHYHPQSFLAPSPIPMLAPSPMPMAPNSDWNMPVAPSPFKPVAPSPDMLIPMASNSDMILPMAPSPNMFMPMAPSPNMFIPMNSNPDMLVPMDPNSNMILPLAPSPMLLPMAPSPSMPMAHSPMLPFFAPSPIPMLHTQDGTDSQCNTPIPVLVKMVGNEIVSVEPVQNSQCMPEQ